MKLLGFKQSLLDRLSLVKSIIIFTFQKETAYWANNWTSAVSTTVYTLAMLVFINVLYQNVRTVVGYDKNEMLVFFMMGQITFYLTWLLSYQNLNDFIVDVNRGDLDLLLTKPIPALFYMSFKKIPLLSILRDGVPPTTAVVLSINWSALHPSWWMVVSAIALLILGQLCLHVVQFLATVPVIWLGESKSILKITTIFEHYAGRFIPLEGFSVGGRVAFGVIIPVMVAASFSTSVLLGKSDAGLMLLWGTIISAVALYVRLVVWHLALRNYTSASS